MVSEKNQKQIEAAGLSFILGAAFYVLMVRSPGYFDDIGWGFGMSVRTRRSHLGPWPVSYPPLASVGSYGWPGVYGTGWYNDPAEDLTTILMIQRVPAPPGLPILFDFWTAAYQAIDD